MLRGGTLLLLLLLLLLLQAVVMGERGRGLLVVAAAGLRSSG